MLGTSAPPAEAEPRRKPLVHRWQFWAALAVGCALLIGAAATAAAFRDYEDRIGALQRVIDGADERAAEAEAAIGRASGRLSEREMAVAQREQAIAAAEAAVAAREAAVTAVEQQVAARSIGNGIWTVGVDVEPGTYRVSEALTGYCYWAIYRSGTSGGDIVDNDGPTGGFPTVTLSVGQDFENAGCGTFVRQ